MAHSSATDRLVRLVRLLDLLSTEPYLAAEDICKRLEVSKRTVFRDLAILQKAGVSLRFDPADGYVLENGVKLVHQRLSQGVLPTQSQRLSPQPVRA